jgi:hypothetical protein
MAERKEGRRRSISVREGEERERRGGGDGATRDLRDHAVCSATWWAILESPDEEEDCSGGWATTLVLGVLGGIRDEASPSNWRDR